MKVFISWSGELSKKIAEAIREWLPGVLQAVKPFFTPNDIEKGARWAAEIASELKSSSVGLFVITSENIEKPWIMFEAGAISRELDTSKICILMFGVESTDLKGPLTQFQATRFEKTDFKKLIININSALGDNKLDTPVLEEVFEIFWPRLNERLSKIISTHNPASSSKPSRDQRDILEEVLNLTRSIQKEINNIPQPKITPQGASVIKYENSLYSSFMSAIESICFMVNFTNEDIDLIEPVIDELSEIVSSRPMSRTIKTPILEKLDEISKSLDFDRKNN